jgi:hypothetical protein
MIFLIITLTLYLACVVVNGEEEELCVHSQMHWLNHMEEWPTVFLSKGNNVSMRDLQICNTSYESIMRIEALKLTHSENMLWVSSFHQYCTAQLNQVKMINDMVISVHNHGSNTINITNAISVVGDTLERFCQNMSGFQYLSDVTLYYYMEMLHAFNTGAFQGLHACNQTSNQINQSSLYYRHLPDLIIIPLTRSPSDGEGNETYSNATSIIDKLIMYSLLDDTYRARTFLIVTDTFAYFVLIPSLIAIILFTRDSKRRFITTTRMDISDGEESQSTNMTSSNVGMNPLYFSDDLEIDLSSKNDVTTSDVTLSSDHSSTDDDKKNT